MRLYMVEALTVNGVEVVRNKEGYFLMVEAESLSDANKKLSDPEYCNEHIEERFNHCLYRIKKDFK